MRTACADAAFRAGARAGFSLIEALIVLIVAAMALTLIFGVGGKANETAFRLGRRALIAADGRLGTDSLGAIVAGIALAPADAGPVARSGAERFAGEAGDFRADAMLDVATPCAPAGPTRNLHLQIVRGGEGAFLTCRVGAGVPVILLDLGRRQAAFSYSLNGVLWTDHWTEPERRAPVGGAQPREQRLFVRLATDDGSLDVTGRASSDRPELQPEQQPAGDAR